MLEKNLLHKIPVMQSSQGEEAEPQHIVPQNSLTDVQRRMGLSERHTKLRSMNRLRNLGPATINCAHCENLAKNFLYLESLMRSNYHPDHGCPLCYSAIKYLQFVNKSIIRVFGHFDTIAGAAEAFALPLKRKGGKRMSRSTQKPVASTTAGTATESAPGTSDNIKPIKRKKSKVIQQLHPALINRQEGGGIVTPERSVDNIRQEPKFGWKKIQEEKIAVALQRKNIQKTPKTPPQKATPPVKKCKLRKTKPRVLPTQPKKPIKKKKFGAVRQQKNTKSNTKKVPRSKVQLRGLPRFAN